MKAFTAFTKKEWMESIRSWRLYILLAVFLLLGIMSPLTALIMPHLLNGADLGGIIIELPEPTALDSWTQFFSNVSQIGNLTLIITFTGIMANEFSRGTLINLLTKGMKRYIIILSKFFTASVIWTLGYLLCLGVTYLYTALYWPESTLYHPFLAFFSPWLLGQLFIVLLILGGIATGNFYGSLLAGGGTVIGLNVLNLVPAIRRFNPISLAAQTLTLLTGQNGPQDFLPAVYLTLISISTLLILSILIFNKKKI